MPRIGKTRCTACGKPMEGVTCVEVQETREKGLKTQRKGRMDEERLPKPGDPNVCIYCGHIMAFDENLQLRDLTPDEELKIAGDPALMVIQQARTAVIKKHGKIG